MTNHVSRLDSPGETCDQYAELTDQELLTIIGEDQDRLALTELYNRYKLPLSRFLQRLLGEPKLVEECYNDVMLVVWQKGNNFRGDSKVSTWIFSIAYRTQLTHSKRENRHRHCDSDEVMDIHTSQKQAEMETQNSVNESLYAALTELSEQHRSVIELSYFHGYSTEEISVIVGCPQNTVKTRLFHARKKLKAALEAPTTLTVEKNSNEQGNKSPKKTNDSYLHTSTLHKPSDRLH